MMHQIDNFTVSTDKSKLDIALIHSFLSKNSYWAEDIPMQIVETSVANALCFGLYDGDQQIGFARVVSDFATFAYLADVFILESHRGRGLSKWLMECIQSHPQLQGLRRWMLATRDAHSLYAQYGFKPLSNTDRFMEKHTPGIYNNYELRIKN